jgi:diguanylate cyclase (GGDEF)-like protein
LKERLSEINRRLEELSSAPSQNVKHSEEFVALFQEKRNLEQSLPSSPKFRHSSSVEVVLRDQAGADTRSGSILANVNRELSKLEKRDWELWWIVSLTGILVGVGLLVIILPTAFVSNDHLHFEITVPRQLAAGLMVLLILLNTYLVSRRIEVRHLRERMISGTIQNELVRLQSFTDPLTEVYNRRSLEDLAGRYISHARRIKKPLTFMLIDVDRFKEVNSRFGHLTGDFVLAEIASLLRSSIRGCDAVVRYGGDEFLTILADASAGDAQTVIERMQVYLNDWNKCAHLDQCTIGLSIGVAEWKDGQTLDEALDQADQNMYAKKAQSATTRAGRSSSMNRTGALLY